MVIPILCAAAALGLAAALPVSVLISAHRPRPERTADCVIILGCRVRPSGSPCTTLRLRCRTGAELLLAGGAGCAIVCGGRLPDEPRTEASAMREELLALGVPDRSILLEDRSLNTRENLENARAIMQAHGLRSAILVTSDYHLSRALWIARDVGLTDVTGRPAPVPRGLRKRLKQLLRESISRIKYLSDRLRNK